MFGNRSTLSIHRVAPALRVLVTLSTFMLVGAIPVEASQATEV